MKPTKIPYPIAIPHPPPDEGYHFLERLWDFLPFLVIFILICLLAWEGKRHLNILWDELNLLSHRYDTWIKEIQRGIRYRLEKVEESLASLTDQSSEYDELMLTVNALIDDVEEIKSRQKQNGDVEEEVEEEVVEVIKDPLEAIAEEQKELD